jgi:hypothetical protein
VGSCSAVKRFLPPDDSLMSPLVDRICQEIAYVPTSAATMRCLRVQPLLDEPGRRSDCDAGL